MSCIEIKIERVAMTPLETAESWVRTNPVVAAVIVGLVIVIVYMSFFSGPKNYQDCVIQVSKEAKTERGAAYGKSTCREKFPKPPPTNRFGGIPVK